MANYYVPPTVAEIEREILLWTSNLTSSECAPTLDLWISEAPYRSHCRKTLSLLKAAKRELDATFNNSTQQSVGPADKESSI